MPGPARSSTRRSVLLGAALSSVAVLAEPPAGTAARAPMPDPEPRLDRRPTAAAAALGHDPFTVGVASGDPDATSVVIWTRLAPWPFSADGLGGMSGARYDVRWEVASDERFTDVVRRGVRPTGPVQGYALHVEVRGLAPGRDYHYRFALGRWRSPVGRTRTAPTPGSPVGSMTVALASCSNFPAGYFTAYRHLADERPDLVLHLGDYRYENQTLPNTIGRAHAGPETTTLAGYRQRYAQYKADPDLQAAHAAAPWLPVWDDHEVENNYAGDRSQDGVDPRRFRRRRAAAYRAFYENLPLRAPRRPIGADLQIYRRLTWGDLATFHMLDTRQYRSDQACGDNFQVPCAPMRRPERTLLGAPQERWLRDGLGASTTTWDLLGQQTFFARRDVRPGGGALLSMDAWDGYPAQRRRVLDALRDGAVRNPVVLTGDVHAHWANHVLERADDPTSRVLATEIVTSSITSGGDGYDDARGRHPLSEWNPGLLFWNNLRGYVVATLGRREMRVDYRCVPEVTSPGARVFTRRSYVVEDGRPRLHRVADRPLPPWSGRRRDRPSDAEVLGSVTDGIRYDGT